MKIELKNNPSESFVFAVPEFNFGQMQRWTDFEQLTYVLEINKCDFVAIFSKEFSAFREDEILENDPNELEPLIAYKEAGWPKLLDLLENNHPLLKELILYHDYDLLHSLIKTTEVGNHFYSINSITTVSINEQFIILEGICFEIDRRG